MGEFVGRDDRLGASGRQDRRLVEQGDTARAAAQGAMTSFGRAEQHARGGLQVAVTGVHFLKIQKRLAPLGIEPVIRREEVGVAFYRRSDLANL